MNSALFVAIREEENVSNSNNVHASKMNQNRSCHWDKYIESEDSFSIANPENQITEKLLTFYYVKPQ
jgi:hypothetical protein